MWKETIVANLKNYPGISLQGLRKNSKNKSQDNLFPYRESNLVPPEKQVRIIIAWGISMRLFSELLK
jgi:hypothetical protein